MARHQDARVTTRLPARIALGGIWHETNTFSPIATDLTAFRERSLLTGEAILAQGAGTAGVLGGIVAEAAERGADLVPTLFAAAMPGGTVTRDAHQALRARLLERLAPTRLGPWPLAGVILVLHGSMVAEDEPDVEGALLRDVRALIGPRVPLVAILDFHANISPAMVAHADLLLGYATYPHVDTFEKGTRAVELLLQLRDRSIKPRTAFRALPLLIPLTAQRTDGPTPLRDVLHLAQETESQPAVTAVTIAGGFPYADVARAGLSVLVTTDTDAGLAEQLADSLAQAVIERSPRFSSTNLDPDDAIDRALSAAIDARPTILADTSDNPGAGAPGDGTHLLRALLNRRVTGAVVASIADPHAAVAALGAGVGATIRLTVGGKTDPRGGEPVSRDWQVTWAADGTFVNQSPIGRGGMTRLGLTAVLASDGVEVIVCERRQQMLDPGLFPAVGIDTASRRIVALKSSVHFRAAFADFAGAIVEVGGPGLSSSDLSSFPYRHVRRPIAPLDPMVTARV